MYVAIFVVFYFKMYGVSPVHNLFIIYKIYETKMVNNKHRGGQHINKFMVFINMFFSVYLEIGVYLNKQK